MKTKNYKFEQITINYDKKRKPLSAKQRADMQGKYRYYGAQSVIDYVNDYLFDGEYLLIAEDGENLKSGKQNIAQIVEGQFWLNNHAHIVQTNELCNIRFLEYWLNSADISGYITGSAQPKLSQANLNAIEVFLPSRDIQDKIVNILYSFDQKIEINNQINRNLSEQMQAIFGSIFYSEMEKGNKASLGDYLYIKGRIGWKGLKKEEYLSESEYRIINGESLTVTGIDWNKAGYISEERYIESPEIMLQEGDILISKDGTIGKIGYVNKLDKPTSVASGIFVVRNLKPEEVSTVFIYCLLNSDYFKSFIASRTEGSVIPHLYQKDFVTLEIPILSQEQIELFNSTVVPLFELFFSNQTENIRLAALRDSLLPKLMSGELDVLDLDI